MNEFIELTRRSQTGVQNIVLVAVSDISMILHVDENDSSKGTYIYFKGSDSSMTVNEDYEYIKEMITVVNRG